MNEQMHRNCAPTGLETRIESDITNLMQNNFRRQHQTPDARTVQAVEACSSSFAAFIASKLVHGFSNSNGEFGWFRWRDLVADAIEAYFQKAADSRWLAGMRGNHEFAWQLTEGTAASLAAMGVPLKAPTWGTDLRNSALAARQVTEPRQLIEMVADLVRGKMVDDGTIGEELITNLNLAIGAAARLARTFRGVNEFGYQLCSRPDATPEALDEWSDHWDESVTKIIAKHPNTSLETLKKLAISDNPWVVEEALSNARLPQEFVDGFATSPLVSARAIVARRTMNPTLLAKLAEDDSEIVRLEAVKNERTPSEVICRTAETDEDVFVVAAAAKRLTDSKLLDAVVERWIPHLNEELKKAILGNPHSSDVAKTATVLACR